MTMSHDCLNVSAGSFHDQLFQDLKPNYPRTPVVAEQERLSLRASHRLSISILRHDVMHHKAVKTIQIFVKALTLEFIRLL